MTADPTVLDRIFDRLVRTLSGGSPDQLSATFTVSEIVHALVPYRTYRGELGVDTLQDYEHAVLELLAGERGLLVCDPDTIAVIRKELATPDPDTQLLRRLQTVTVRLGAVRMPVPPDEPRSAREPGQLISTTREMPAIGADVVVSDAIAIGAALAPGACPVACQQLVPGSPLLDALNEDDETPDGPQWLSLWTTQDETVTPPTSARLDGAVNVELQAVCPALQVSHADLPRDPVVTRLVLAALAAPTIVQPTAEVC